MSVLVIVLAVIGALTVAVWTPVLALLVLVGIKATLAPPRVERSRR